jgi:3'(2'), 5'-bisphosphate nucleotidase
MDAAMQLARVAFGLFRARPIYREHDMQAELEAARTLAVRAGAILLEHYSAPAVRWKGRGNPVTEADRAASAFLVKELRRFFPTDGILSEEESDDAMRLSLSRVWIIDPLDGTIEFIDHRDEFAVMIGLSIDGTADLGVVYQPTTEKLYYAASGSGAFLIENRSSRLLRVSRESNPAAMTMALSRSHHSAAVDDVQRRLGIQATVTSGSIGLKVGLICEGRAHLYLHTSRDTSQWDTCAPDVILREAGGRMTDVFNEPLRYNGTDLRNLQGVIASSGTIHDRIAEAAGAALSGRL